MVKSKGFTLIELMIVIAIVGIIFSIFAGIPRGNTGSGQVNDDLNGDSSGTTDMIIDGVAQKCNEFGECKPAN